MLHNNNSKDKDWSTIRNRASYTPDWLELKKSKQSKFLVFVTGNLRKGRSGASILKDCDYYGTGVTIATDYMLKRPIAGSQEPILLKLPVDKEDNVWKSIHLLHSHLNAVEGDVYALTPRVISLIDEYEENTLGVNRKKGYVKMINQPNLFRSQEMFMYITDTDEYLNYVKGHSISPNCTLSSRTVDNEWIRSYCY